MASEPSTRERIISEAIRLFAERGFTGTTVGDIEQAAGLAPRSGGLYKHFPSKEAVLEAAAQRHVGQIEALRSALDFRPLGNLRAELTLVARWSLAELRAERPLIKIVQKDGDQFPVLVKLVRERVVDTGHRTARAVLELLLSRNGVEVENPDALAAVLVGSLVGRDVEEMMFGSPPGGLEEDDFVEAWVECWLTFARGAGATLDEPAAQAAT